MKTKRNKPYATCHAFFALFAFIKREHVHSPEVEMS